MIISYELQGLNCVRQKGNVISMANAVFMLVPLYIGGCDRIKTVFHPPVCEI